MEACRVAQQRYKLQFDWNHVAEIFDRQQRIMASGLLLKSKTKMNRTIRALDLDSRLTVGDIMSSPVRWVDQRAKVSAAIDEMKKADRHSRPLLLLENDGSGRNHRDASL